MHAYSIDTDRRPKIFLSIAIISMAIPLAWDFSKKYLCIPSDYSLPVSFSTSFGLLYFVFKTWAWKVSEKISGTKDLNGIWEGKGISSFIDEKTGKHNEYIISITIEQDYNKIEIYAQTDSSTSRSTMASISVDTAMPVFKYTYDNVPNNLANAELQRHPGMIELNIISDTEMKGGYFSGKHRLSYGQIHFVRKV